MTLKTRIFRLLDSFRGKKPAGVRQYAGARSGRTMFNASAGSADSELNSSLATLRQRSRALCRDVVYAKRAKTIVVNNVVGQGVGMQAQVKNRRGRLLAEINDPIETAWQAWCKPDTCHTGGTLHFGDFERAAMSEVFAAGEVFIRLHRRPFGAGLVPLALELIEAERIADDYEIKAPSGAAVVQGVEIDEFGRPIAYYIHRWHKNDLAGYRNSKIDEIQRIPADDVIHLKVTERWPQTRGEPWLHAAITRLNHLGEYEEAAVIAAQVGAEKVMLLKETEDGRLSETLGNKGNDGTLNWSSSKGQVDILPSGTDVVDWNPQYPHENFDPFTRACLRGIAAGVGVSYESLSRDYSQSNYSSSRLALLDDRDLWRVMQTWWIRAFRQPLHDQWLQAAVMSRAVPIDLMSYGADMARYAAVKFKPRGWSWVDPTKEVNAYKEAERAGYITKTDIIAATAGGLDIEDIAATRRQELDLLASLDLTTDTDPIAPAAPGEPEPPEEQDDGDEEQGEPAARLYRVRKHD